MRVNLLIPSVGLSDFFKDSYYPKTLVEINGKPMIQRIVEEYEDLPNVHYLFLLREEECIKFHTDNIVKLLTNDHCDILKIKEDTKGALCTSLLAIEHIDNDDRLIIVNNDEIRDVDYDEVIRFFDGEGADAGVISFDNYHPRWTYIRTDHDNVVEVAEKKPISRNAVTGFYYFRRGCDFVEAAMNRIRKGNTVNGVYYVSGALNELILKGRLIKHFHIEADRYHSFYSMERIKAYEKQQT